MYDVEAFKRAYPEWFPPTTAMDILTRVFIFALIFLIPYIYVRFVERRLVSFVRNRVIPFIRFKLHLEKPIILIERILKTPVFKSKSKS
jgi:peptidoglycan/LPS O-acetylase OafA/YrhL